MDISDFENQTIALQNVHSFLLTALIRPLLRDAGKAGAEKIISDLQREFSTQGLPANVRTDDGTLTAISDRHRMAQEYMAQLLRYADPHSDEG